MPTNLSNTHGKSVSPHTHVQFIGYAISTVPKLYVENPIQPGVNKYYLGLEDEKTDIEARIELLSMALRAAQQAFQPEANILRIFVIPEFFFRGNKGAYHTSHEQFLTACLQTILQEHAPNIDLAVFGTSLFCPQKVDYTEPAIAKNFALGDDFLNIYRACRNYRASMGLATPSMQEMLFYLDELECLQDEQALAGPTQNSTQNPTQNPNPKLNFKQIPGPRTPLEAVLQETLAASDQEAPLLVSNVCQLFLSGQRHLRVQKKFKSKVDFVLNYYCDSARTQKNHNAYLQTFVKYPPVANNTEVKENDLDPYGIFTWNGLKIGIEICLDHIRQRMSRTVDDLDLQIIPSCGVEVTLNGVAARTGGYVFNCDGDYNLEDAQNGLGSHTQLYQVKQSRSDLLENTSCLPPAQLARLDQTAKLGKRIQPNNIIKIAAPDKNIAAPGKNNAAPDAMGDKELYAFGTGELHVYPALPLPK